MMKGNLRWWVVSLVALATVINYIDRQAMGILWPDIKAEFGFSNQDYANIFGVFVLAYAFGQTIFGKIFDWLGTRIGFVLSIGVWSIATALHAFGSSVLTFQIFRVILGAAEAGNWPGASKANAEWFPVKERALAQGIFNSGAAKDGKLSLSLLLFLVFYGLFLGLLFTNRSQRIIRGSTQKSVNIFYRANLLERTMEKKNLIIIHRQVKCSHEKKHGAPFCRPCLLIQFGGCSSRGFRFI